ncbi:hypothetical protein [Saccharopolyspora phatthalungensis]|uniref:Uncharacterized protein n=1 Tax=Saccharopolyspora phatthalungensis TaxID=664693 RepID=A0A840QFB3_9PSEU|nr:hypothetical protein [Saccharopolyspora phatthalungensis]MBB5157398.1 hypothetical protein [Saccharopolyspora phatthalungensis]
MEILALRRCHTATREQSFAMLPASMRRGLPRTPDGWLRQVDRMALGAHAGAAS